MESQDAYLKECFQKPPLTAFRKQPNIRNLLIKSKIPPPPNLYPRRELKGMKKCGKSCPTCPYVYKTKEIKIHNKKSWRIDKNVSCESYNIIYLLHCTKCGQNYIGTTGRQLKLRLAEHRGYIINQVTSKSTGAHWNLSGHSLDHLKVSVLEQVKSNDEDYRLEREKYFIRKFNTFNEGINREW